MKSNVNREEKSLRHVALVANFLDDNKPKIHQAGAVVQPRQRNEQKSMMHVQICFLSIKTFYFFASLLPSPLSLVLLSSKNGATMVMWRHTSPVYKM